MSQHAPNKISVPKQASLTPEVTAILLNAATEPPGTDTPSNLPQCGAYICKGCGQSLFLATARFSSPCGWPAFDNAISSHISETTDADGRRQEICCAACKSHLGHVFRGEQLTATNTRYCVNSLAIDWINDSSVLQTDELIVAAGCFWGVQKTFSEQPGVLATEVGYSGGSQTYPSYEQVCSGTTGHVEAVRIVFDPQQISSQQLLQVFFSCHNPAQQDGQGVDIGSQYLSVIFYYNEMQHNIAQHMILQYEQQLGLELATKCQPVTVFWPAETYHQHYLKKVNNP